VVCRGLSTIDEGGHHLLNGSKRVFKEKGGRKKENCCSKGRYKVFVSFQFDSVIEDLGRGLTTFHNWPEMSAVVNPEKDRVHAGGNEHTKDGWRVGAPQTIMDPPSDQFIRGG